MVEVTGIGKRFSGNYTLNKVTHTINQSGYQTQFEVTQKYSSSLLQSLRKKISESPSPNKREKVNGVVIGIVKNNVDLEGLGRVQLSFPHLSDLNTALRPGIVHRLDKATSGLLLVAKDNKTHAVLAKQFKKSKIKKRYVALVEGNVEFDEGVVDVPLGRDLNHREKRSVQFDDSAKEATTYYQVLKRATNKTLIALFPKTGRMHQLRVHMAYLKHPILGDQKYGQRRTFPRLALHAQSIGFMHPQRNCYVEFSSKVPEEFLAIENIFNLIRSFLPYL